MKKKGFTFNSKLVYFVLSEIHCSLKVLYACVCVWASRFPNNKRNHLYQICKLISTKKLKEYEKNRKKKQKTSFK